MTQIEFLLGVDGFSSGAIISAFFAGHIPYLVYYFFLKFRVSRLPASY